MKDIVAMNQKSVCKCQGWGAGVKDLFWMASMSSIHPFIVYFVCPGPSTCNCNLNSQGGKRDGSPEYHRQSIETVREPQWQILL